MISELIEKLYGMPAGLMVHPDQAYSRAKRASRSDSFHPAYTNLELWHGEETNHLRTALEHAVSTPIYPTWSGFLLNAVLVDVPFRHEAVWIELEAPHTCWVFAEGWTASPSAENDRFMKRWRRVKWLFTQLPNYDHFKGHESQHDTQAFEFWLSELGAPNGEKLRSEWAASEKVGSADAFYFLLAAYFIGADDFLVVMLDETEGHPAAIVRSTRDIVHEARWGKASDWLFDLMRTRRAAMVERISARAPIVSEDTVRADVSSQLTIQEALALLKSKPFKRLMSDGRGDAAAQVAAAIGRPEFASIEELEIEARLLRVASAVQLSQYASALRSIKATEMDQMALEVLGQSAATIKSLICERGGRIGPEGFVALARGPAFATLETFVTKNTHSKEEGILSWVKSGRMRHLVRLELPNTYSGADVDGMGERAAEALLSTDLSRLQELDLGSQRLGEKGLVAFATNSRMGPLRILRLEGVWMTGPTIAPVIERKFPLEGVDFSRSSVGAEGAQAIGQHCRALRWLKVCNIGDDGAEALARGQFDALTSLSLNQGGLGDRGLIALAQAPWLARVTTLDLSDNPIGESGALALAASPHATQIERLEFYKAKLTDAAAFALARLPKLRHLKFYESGVTKEGQAQLAAQRPDVSFRL